LLLHSEQSLADERADRSDELGTHQTSVDSISSPAIAIRRRDHAVDAPEPATARRGTADERDLGAHTCSGGEIVMRGAPRRQRAQHQPAPTGRTVSLITR
jgi:hypothetical protein